MARASAAFLAFNDRKRRAAQAAERLQAIANALDVPAVLFFAPPDPALEELRRAYIAAAEAYTQGLHRAAQSVSLAETA